MLVIKFDGDRIGQDFGCWITMSRDRTVLFLMVPLYPFLLAIGLQLMRARC